MYTYSQSIIGGVILAFELNAIKSRTQTHTAALLLLITSLHSTQYDFIAIFLIRKTPQNLATVAHTLHIFSFFALHS